MVQGVRKTMILDCLLRFTILYILVHLEKLVTLVTHSKSPMSVGKSTPQWTLCVQVHFRCLARPASHCDIGGGDCQTRLGGGIIAYS